MTTQDLYAPPGAALDGPASASAAEAERIRSEHLSHEVSLRALGALFYAGGGFLVLAALGGFGAARGAPGMLVVSGFYVVFSLAQLVVGHGLRARRPWVRVPAGVLCGIGLLALPLGTLISAWGIWLVFGRKGRVVLSTEYAAIVDQTPHLRYRTPPWLMALALLFAALLALAIFRLALG